MIFLSFGVAPTSSSPWSGRWRSAAGLLLAIGLLTRLAALALAAGMIGAIVASGLAHGGIVNDLMAEYE